MTLLAVLAGLVGTGLTVVGLLFLGLATVGAVTARVAARVPEVSCAEAAQCAARRRVAVRGRIVPGPGGPTVAPLSGSACVWWGVRVVRATGGVKQRRNTVILRRDSGAPFAVADRSGRVLVDDGLLDVFRVRSPLTGDLAACTVSEEVRHRHDAMLDRLVESGLAPRRPRWTLQTDWISVTEYIVRAGPTATAVGRPRRGPGGTVLSRPWSGHAYLRRPDRAATLAHLRDERRTAREGAAIFLRLGLPLAAAGWLGLWLLGR